MHLTCPEMTGPHTTFFLAGPRGSQSSWIVAPTLFRFLAEWGDWWPSAAIGLSSSQTYYGGAGWRGSSSGGLPLAWKGVPAKPSDACGVSLFPALPGQLTEARTHAPYVCVCVCVVYMHTQTLVCTYHTLRVGRLVWKQRWERGWEGNGNGFKYSEHSAVVVTLVLRIPPFCLT